MIELRDMRESDIEDYVRWFTETTDWMRTDAPWENEETTAEAERKSWREYYEAVRDLPADAVRRKFEIEADGLHVGWVCRYTDLGEVENPEKLPAVGIDIAESAFRGRGVGTEALRAFILYLKEKGFPAVYTQTWSGNAAMMRVAEKLGFTLCSRLRDIRAVEGKKYDALTYRLELSGAAEE